MSGNLSSPWIVNSRLELSNKKYAEVLSTTTENLKTSLLALDYETLRQVDGAGYGPGMSWNSQGSMNRSCCMQLLKHISFGWFGDPWKALTMKQTLIFIIC